MVRTDAEERLAAALAGQDRPTPAGFLSVVRDHVRNWNAAAAIPAPAASLIEAGVLQNSLPAYLLLDRRGDPFRASQWVLHTWNDYRREMEGLAPVPDAGAILDYDLAVVDFLSTEENARSGQRALGRLVTRLGLSQDEAGRMFEVSGETVRRWQRGQVRIPSARAAELAACGAALDRLEAIFAADRLSQAIRRRADLFGGERALDWILRGRLADVACAYEHALEYQA